jgi:hypothetical protein
LHGHIVLSNSFQDILIKIKKMSRHLKETNKGYWEHWLHATKIGIALLIHAWLPNILKDYASDKICKKDE